MNLSQPKHNNPTSPLILSHISPILFQPIISLFKSFLQVSQGNSTEVVRTRFIIYRSPQIFSQVDTWKIPANRIYSLDRKYQSASHVEIAKYHDSSRWLKAKKKREGRNLCNLISLDMTGVVINSGISKATRHSPLARPSEALKASF